MPSSCSTATAMHPSPSHLAMRTPRSEATSRTIGPERAQQTPGGVVTEGRGVVGESGEVDEEERSGDTHDRHSGYGSSATFCEAFRRLVLPTYGRCVKWRHSEALPSPHGSPVHVLPVGRHPTRLRRRRRFGVRGDHRRPALPRRPEQRLAPDDAAGLPGPQRRTGRGAARADGASSAASASEIKDSGDLGGVYARDRRGAQRHPRRGTPRHREPDPRRRAVRRRAAGRTGSGRRLPSATSGSTCCPTIWPAG